MGYESDLYASSLEEFGTVRRLPRSGGWLLERSIAGSDARDAIGPYPLFVCPDWKELSKDLEELAGKLVSVCVVADPFGDFDEALLRSTFSGVQRFKERFAVDLTQSPEETINKHHRYYARRALDVVKVEEVAEPATLLDEWTSLYGELIERHALKGVKAFSREAFAKQLAMPGLIMMRSRWEDRTVAMHLCYQRGEVIYSHLAAATPEGYKVNAMYAQYWEMIRRFRDRARWFEIGAGAGSDGRADDGLTRFKRGWTSITRPAWFCSQILNPSTYDALTRAAAKEGVNYFPAYRHGEF